MVGTTVTDPASALISGTDIDMMRPRDPYRTLAGVDGGTKVNRWQSRRPAPSWQGRPCAFRQKT